ncbi:MAG: FAD-binding oxidoreductase [Isosphaerales bacterium]
MSSPFQSSREAIPLNLYRVSAPGIARVVANARLTPPGHDDVRHITLDLSGLNYRYLEGQSLGVLPAGVDDRGRPNTLRLYSIASSRRGDDGHGTSASLCVKRLVFTEIASHHLHRGIASNYLCNLKPGDQVAITGPTGKTLLLPEDPASNLILVATGTGIAPFRAFLRRIYFELPEWTGAVYLFFGVRTEAECLYRAEFEAFRDRPGYRLVLAFSREQTTSDGRRLYVQHRMAECIGELRELFSQDNTYLYICGLKGLEEGIEAVCMDEARQDGSSLNSLRAMRKAGRILVETY